VSNLRTQVTIPGLTGRHPSLFATDFQMPDGDDRARLEPLEDRGNANLIVSTSHGDLTQAHIRDLPEIITAGTVMVLNTSGTFFSRVNGAILASGELGTVHFAQMLEDSALHWVVVVPGAARPGNVIHLPGGAHLALLRPYFVRDRQPAWEDWGQLWVARFEGSDCFDHWSPNNAHPIQYPYDTVPRTLPELQNVFSGRPTSAMMNNGGYNLTLDVLSRLLSAGVQIATVEMRTGVGVDDQGIPFPEFVRLDVVNAAIINAALADERLVLPVGTGVIRLLSALWDNGRVRPNSSGEWVHNIITPENGGTPFRAWLSGQHEPDSTHLAMGAAVLGSEQLMVEVARAALAWGFSFHEFGDSHLHLPADRLR
jgi:S-adenosylmethionine:tRNA ribosyltransferase-isomerase